jgi:hypothetical protein
MKRITLTALTLATVATSLVFTSCEKDKKDPKPKTASEKLTAKSWMLTAETKATGTAAPVNTFSDYGSYYERDDIFKFQANNVFIKGEGATRRVPSAPTSITGTWMLSDSDKKIAYVAGYFGTFLYTSNVDGTGEIEELTETKLVVKLTDTSSPPTVVTRQTFTAQ